MPKEEKTVIDELEDIDGDKIDDDDYFEKLLSAEVKNDDDETKEKENIKDDEPTRKELEEQIVTLEKEAKGRLTDTVKSRQERRVMKDELEQLKGAVSNLLDTRKEKQEPTPKPLEDPRKKIEFEEDDSAFVDLTDVKSALSEQGEETQKQLDEIKLAETNRTIKEQYDRTINEVLDIDREKYNPAYVTLQKAVKSLNDRVIEMQNRTENYGDPKTGGLSIDRSLDLIDGTPEEKTFLEDFPGLNPTDIARAFNSKRDLKTALNNISKTLVEDTSNADGILTKKIDDDLLAKAKTKPGSLAGQENQSGASDNLIDRIGNLSSDDIMNVSDAEADKIMKLLLDEEIRGE